MSKQRMSAVGQHATPIGLVIWPKFGSPNLADSGWTAFGSQRAKADVHLDTSVVSLWRNISSHIGSKVLSFRHAASGFAGRGTSSWLEPKQRSTHAPQCCAAVSL